MEQLLPRRANAGSRVVLGRIALRILRATYLALERSRQRRALARLSDARLRDIGLTRDDVLRESAKPFWR
jgi:uncharacterized protein YjiS (DUF1127 family)